MQFWYNPISTLSCSLAGLQQVFGAGGDWLRKAGMSPAAAGRDAFPQEGAQAGPRSQHIIAHVPANDGLECSSGPPA